MDEFINTVNGSVDEINIKMNQIRQFLNENDIDSAKAAAQEILNIDPNDINAHFILGQIEESQENFDQAIEHFEHVVKFQDQPELKARLAQLYEDADQYDKSYDYYKSLFEKQPEDKNLCERLAHVARIIGSNDEAVDYYNKLLTIEPDDIVALTQLMELYEDNNRLMYYLTRARIQELEDRMSYAAESYQKALNHAENSSDIVQIRYKLAENLAKRDKSLQAIDQYMFILEQDDKNFDVYKKLADLYEATDNIESAIETFQRALEIYPDDIEVLAELAELYLEEDINDKALELYQKLVEFEPENKENNIYLAKAQLKLGMNDNALENINVAIRIDENDVSALNVLVDYYTTISEYENAIKTVKKIKNLLPSSPFGFRKSAEIYEKLGNEFKAHYNYAIFHELKGEKQLAVDEYSWALGKQPDNTEIIMKLASLYEDLDEKYIAIEYYEKAYAVDNSLIQPIKRAADIYFAQKDFEQAGNFYQKVLEASDSDKDVFLKIAECSEKIKDADMALNYYKKYYEVAPLSTKSEDVKTKIQYLESKINGEEEEGFLARLLGFFSKK